MATALHLAHLSLLALTPPAFVDVAAEAGFAGVSLRLAPATDAEPQHALPPGSPPLRETRARLQAHGVQVHDVELVRLGPACAPVAEALLAAAAELGARRLLVAGDGEDEAALAEQFAALHARARPYGLDLVGMLRTLPPGCSISIEAPLRGDAPPHEKAQLLYRASQRLLAHAAAVPA